LIERGIVESMDGRIAVGWLIVEDLATVLALVLLPAVAVGLGGTALATSSPAGGVLGTLALALGKLALFVGVMLVVGRRAVPWLLGRAAATGSRELLTLAVLAMSVGVAYFASRLFDVSFALGAFFAGILVGRSNLSHKVAEDVLPLQDAFTVLFFVSVGMLFNPAALFDTPGRLVATIAIIVVGKSLVAAGIVWGFGHPPRTVLLVAASLAQVGEFSFILAELGLQLGLLPDEGRNLILAGAIVSISLNPFVFAGAGRLHAWLAARSVAAERPLPPAPLTVDWLHGHAIIVGAGRVGRVVAAALRAAAVPHLLVEQNRGVAEDVRREGATVLVGDATRLVVLEHAGLADARLLVVAIPSPAEARAVVALARDANPALRIVVRTHDLAEGAALELNGADLVVMGETELAKAMVAFALREARAPGPSR
jgi:CPA2 family monovalent cation:H+ antiporter-2